MNGKETLSYYDWAEDLGVRVGQRIAVRKPSANPFVQEQKTGDCGTIIRVGEGDFDVRWDEGTVSAAKKNCAGYTIRWFTDNYYEVLVENEWEGDLELL